VQLGCAADAAPLASSMLISEETPLILGSGSPRRREILGGLGVQIRVLIADTPERVAERESPSDYLQRVVRQKLEAVAARLDSAAHAGLLVADTIVVLGDQVLGKPAHVADAERIVSMLAGRTHTVFTRYAISTAAEPAVAVRARTVASRVTMRAASPSELGAYARTGEGLDKAGAYAAQGIGSFLIERIEGSCSNVIGLPACEVVLDLKRAGLLGRFP
jgi:septum formation protein